MPDFERRPAFGWLGVLALAAQVAGCGEPLQAPVVAPLQVVTVATPDPVALAVGQGRPTVIE
jgi:hypothetical protein